MSLNIDSVVNCVINIVDNHRCMLCDKLDGSRWRYSCGHVGCGDCAEVSKSCILCLTPFGEESKKPVQDLALTKRVEHAKTLLATCQDALGIDVYTKHRQTEQQKVEKEVFPECIQAISKYSNKRKSQISGQSKDNSILFLPGEKTSPVRPSKSTMEKSFNYLQQWLDNIDDFPKKTSRKSNVKTSTTIKRRSDLIMDKFHESEPALKKTRLSKNEKDESGIVMDDPIYIEDSQDEIKQHDTFDVINVTQSTQDDAPVVDKDRLAWLAVLQAEDNSKNETPSVRLECSEIIQYTNDDIEKSNEVKQQESGNTRVLKVPFFKKSPLTDSCKNCLEDTSDITESSLPKNVDITIESKAFTTTIKMMLVKPNTNSHKKQSVSVQTDISDIETSKVKNVQMSQIKSNEQPLRNPATNIERDSLDLFTDEMKITNDHNVNEAALNLGADYKLEPKQEEKYNLIAHEASTIQELEPIPVIVNRSRTEDETRLPSKRSRTTVQDSDTSDDDGLNKSETLTVTAEVHRSSNQYDYAVFTELIESNLVSRSTLHKKRGRTPNSSDSSDKENRDPNRGKRIQMGKKDPFQKKNRKKLGIVN